MEDISYIVTNYPTINMTLRLAVFCNRKKGRDRDLARGAVNSARVHHERQHKMYSDAIPKQHRMLSTSGCLVLPFFKHVGDLLKPRQLSSLNALAAIWCCIENILLAATAEGLACAIRIPMGDEGKYVAETVGAPKDYVMACYIAIGYPAEDAVLHEQAKVNIDDKLHLNRW